MKNLDLENRVSDRSGDKASCFATSAAIASKRVIIQ
jgi:hypothetical protein